MIDARDAREPQAGPTPVLIKIAPDLTLGELDDIVGVARRARVDGMIVGNTTIGAAADACAIARRRRRRAVCRAGRCFALATRMLAETYVRVEGAFPLIGVGGIDSGATALAKIRAGATWCSSTARWFFTGLAWSARSRRDFSMRSIAARRCDAGRSGRRRCRRDDRGAVAGS